MVDTVLAAAQRLNADTVCVVGALCFSGDRLTCAVVGAA